MVGDGWNKGCFVVWLLFCILNVFALRARIWQSFDFSLPVLYRYDTHEPNGVGSIVNNKLNHSGLQIKVVKVKVRSESERWK